MFCICMHKILLNIKVKLREKKSTSCFFFCFNDNSFYIPEDSGGNQKRGASESAPL